MHETFVLTSRWPLYTKKCGWCLVNWTSWIILPSTAWRVVSEVWL